MKKIVRTLIAICIFTGAWSVVHADDVSHTPPPDNSSAELNRIKTLAGRWESTTSAFGKEDEKVYTKYTIVAGGSAVLERFAPGTPYEMSSVYYDNDKGKLTMTHYCLMRNRPTLTLKEAKDDTLTLNVTKVEGLKNKKDPHMGDITLTFKDADHFSSSCSGQKEGKGDKPPMTMEFTRVKGKNK